MSRMLGSLAVCSILVAFGAGRLRAASEPAESAAMLTGRIVDTTSGEGLPFASVGAPQSHVGTVSDEAGYFRLAAPSSDSTIVISALGYRTERLPAADWQDGRVVRLVQVELGFREQVTVTAEASGKPRIYGKKLPARGFGVGYGSAFLGAEIGSRIRIDGPTYLESAHFTVSHKGGERFLYRVNLYAFVDGEVGENLLQQNVTVSAAQQRGTLDVDLREQGLIVDHDVLLALEWIRDDREMGNSRVMFRAKPRSRGTLYLKPTSQMPFSKVRRLNLGFHLTGYPLE